MSYNKQKYYDKEYKRLITQAKRMYNDLNLGGILYGDMPSFEKILNRAGTSSGLKKPTKASLKALRKLQTEEDILRGIYYTMPKRSEMRDTIRDMIDNKELLNKALKNARKTIKETEKKKGGQPKKTKYKEERAEYVYTKPIETIIFELKSILNYCESEIPQRQKSSGSRGRTAYENVVNGRDTANELISYCLGILNSNDTDKIKQLGENWNDFIHDNPGGIDLIDMYKKGPQIKKYLFNELMNTNKQDDNQIEIDLPGDNDDTIFVDENGEMWIL